ncbi:AMP-binding protein [Nocardioides sp. dk4132]|uniref:(2,3-dihydroxybenzoyl)adenylate synthase n=1 Tax=unclassified Nocardioides TaxID=2615069 RepID=UPI001297D892|nr:MULTISPECIES: AMP-binding protein [unclassified Nocardioides]MQW75280.1 AMP-binding protein [Nocardioides sp. dk4132]QGA07569.1 AMP-binding protein [Nocardioides sp. dk884]
MSARSPLAQSPTWPEEARAVYRAAGLWTTETFADFVADRTTRYADRLAVVGRDVHGADHRWSYARLGREADHAAARFAALGVAQGDRVVVALPNVVEYVAVVLGLFRLGALPVFALPSHRELELSQFCALADASALVLSGNAADVDHRDLHAAVAARVAQRGVVPPLLVAVRDWDAAVSDDDAPPAGYPAPRLDAEQVAFLQLSGGTTGVSKLIPRTHADYLYSVRASAEICALDATTRMLVVLPAAHNFAMSSPGILGVLHAGGTVVLAGDPSPRTAFGLVARERVTLVSLVPPLAQAWISAARRRTPDLSSLRLVQVGGAKLAPGVAAEIEPVLGARLQQVFGMAEGLVNYTRPEDPEELVLTTQGRPISAYDEIRVVDADGVDVPDGEEGQLLTRGPYTIRGYYRADGPNRDSFTDDGFYRTGDLVRRLPSGHLVVTGREKDQINRGGEKIASDEIEDLLLTHPGVLDAVAVGVPDPYLGERIAVVVVPEPDHPLPEPVAAHLGAYLRDAGLATYKLPDQVVVLDAFPTTPVGKNSRRDLRHLLAARLTDVVPPATPAAAGTSPLEPA